MGERAPLLAKAVGGRVVGPRPGLAIVSFWQGILEIILRALALVCSIAVIVPGAVATLKIDGEKSPNISEGTMSLGKAACGVVIFGGFIGVVLETTTIVLRFVNVGLINLKIKYFLLVDVFIDAGLVFVFMIGAVGSAVSAKQWSGHSNIEHTLGAAAVISFFCMVVFIALGGYLLAFIIKKWNKQVIVYTLKDAVLG